MAGVDGAEADIQLIACMVDARCMAGRANGIAKLTVLLASDFIGVARMLACIPCSSIVAGMSYVKRGGRRRVDAGVAAADVLPSGTRCGSSSSFTRGLTTSTSH